MSLVNSSSAKQSSFATVLAPVASLFYTTLTLLVNLIKSSLNKYTFLALTTYEELSNALPQWDDVLKRAGRKDTDLRDIIGQLRGVCLRSFPELLLDVKAAGTKTSGDLGTGIHEITKMVVEYLSQIPEVIDAVGTALMALGDGMWRMGSGAGKVLGKSDTGDERIIIEHYICKFPLTGYL